MKNALGATFSATVAGVVAMIIASLPAYGGLAFMIGLVALPIIAICCLVLSFVLLFLRSKFNFAPTTFFFVSILSGFVAGAIVSITMTSGFKAAFTYYGLVFHGSYGIVGAICAFGGWVYARNRTVM